MYKTNKKTDNEILPNFLLQTICQLKAMNPICMSVGNVTHFAQKISKNIIHIKTTI